MGLEPVLPPQTLRLKGTVLGDEGITAQLSLGGAARAEMLRNMNSRERSILSGDFNSLERLRIPLKGTHIIDFLMNISIRGLRCCTQVSVQFAATLRLSFQ
jgi:hypothetical protein